MEELTPLDDIVLDGIKFLRSITDYYGQEKGMEVWHAMGSAMGEEIQGKIFFAMLTGTVSGKVKFHNMQNTSGNAVAVIKCIREYTGLGLREAKDLWDLSKMKTVKIEVSAKAHREFVDELRTLGVTAN